MFLINLNIVKKDTDRYLFLSDIIDTDEFSFDHSILLTDYSKNSSSISSTRYKYAQSVTSADLVFKIKDKIFLFSPSLLNSRFYYTPDECYHQVFLLKNLLGYIYYQPEIYHVSIIKNRYSGRDIEINPSDFEIIDTRKDPIFISSENFQSSIPPQFIEREYFRGYKTCGRCNLLTHGDTNLKVYMIDSAKGHTCIFCTDLMKDSLIPKDKVMIENDLKQVRLIRPLLEEEWLLHRMKKEL